MKSYFQNKVSTSGTTFWVVALYAFLIWLLSDGLQQNRWLQLGSLLLTSYLFIELNISNSLIRIRSRMVSSTFLVLYSAFPVLFGSPHSNFLFVCLTAFFLIIFSSYQSPQAKGLYYLAFLLIGLCSMVDIKILFFVPFLWILCATQLQSLSWQTWGTSVVGLLTPYWLFTPLLFRQDYRDLAIAHIDEIKHFSTFFDLSVLTFPQLMTLALIISLSVVSITHLWQKAYEDRIQTRQYYGFFVTLFLLASAFFIIQPALYQLSLPIIIVCASPIIAHFIALTSSKATNLLFITAVILLIVLTIISLFPPLSHWLFHQLNLSWNGLSVF